MKTTTINYFTHAIPEDPEQPGFVTHELTIEVPEDQAEAKVRELFNSDGSTSVHRDDVRRWAPDLLDDPIEA